MDEIEKKIIKKMSFKHQKHYFPLQLIHCREIIISFKDNKQRTS